MLISPPEPPKVAPAAADPLREEWGRTRKQGWSRPLEAAEAQALFELIDVLQHERDRINQIATDLGKSVSRSLNRQDRLTELLYGVGYTARPYDRHGIIQTRRDPFLQPSCRTTAPSSKRAPVRHKRSRRKAAR